ncbi:hypothetical protein GQ44DRAFT_707019 [Phaeosphaeriaceae sp. PMI808]|nr:hypothetical protein GQ44DRAFT_707019 [Phaeosphaeriaceae sp. PMI808]
MSSPKTKRDISRQTLESHGVFYNADVYSPPYILPEHVDAVRETLLSFEGIIPEGGWIETLLGEVKKYGSDGIGIEASLPLDISFVPIEAYEAHSQEKSPQWHAAFENLKSCRKIAEIARELRADSEDGWMHFWRSHSFTLVSSRARDQPGFQ